MQYPKFRVLIFLLCVIAFVVTINISSAMRSIAVIGLLQYEQRVPSANSLEQNLHLQLIDDNDHGWCSFGLSLLNNSEPARPTHFRLGRAISLYCEPEEAVINRYNQDVAANPAYQASPLDVIYVSQLADKIGDTGLAHRLRTTYAGTSMYYVGLGNIAVDSNRGQQADVFYDIALKISSDFDPLRINMYREFCFRAINDSATESTACDNFYRALDRPLTRFLLGRYHFVRANYVEAIKWFELSIKADNLFMEGYYWLGEAYREFGRITESKHAFQQGIDHDQTFTDNYFGLATTLAQQGCISDAQAILKQIERIDDTQTIQEKIKTVQQSFVEYKTQVCNQ